MPPPDVQNPADPIYLVVQFAAILLELGGAVLVAVLFILIRRPALDRAYFATWTSAWVAMVAGIGAVAARYELLGRFGLVVLPESSPTVRVLYFVYQAGKLLFWVLVCRGAFEYAGTAILRARWWVIATLVYASLTMPMARDLNMLVVWQAPVAVLSCVAGAYALLLPAGRGRSLGSAATGGVLAGSALLWTVYFVVFAGVVHKLPHGMPWLEDQVTRYNSSADVLMIVTLGFAMVVLFMDDARLRVAESESRLTALVASAAEAIVTTDSDLRVLDANRAAERMFGIDRATAVGLPVDSFVTGEHRARVRAVLEAFLAGKDTTVALEGDDVVRAVRPDGTRVIVEGSASKMRANATTSLALVMRDVTERREAEERERQAQKMEAVRQLAGGLAHDFNNLLTAIVGRSQIIARSLPAESPVREGLAEVERTATSAAKLAHGLLALSRREPLHPARIAVNALLRSLEDQIRTVAGPLNTTEFHYADDAGDVHVDVAHLRDVLLAMTQNAREAIGAAGGRVSLETARITWQQEPGRNLDAACISIRDTGPGLTERARVHLFEPFFSTKGDGRGLGLATAYAFLQQSGGSLDVQSGSIGTIVRLALPLLKGEALATAREPAPASAARPQDTGYRGPRTVLVVEDEEAVRRFVRVVLEREGFRVLEAENGMSALEVCQAADPPVHVLLTDVVMPQMGGRELASRVLLSHPEVRVIFMSGFVNDGDLLAGLNSQTTPFLQKPFDIAELARVVHARADTE